MTATTEGPAMSEDLEEIKERQDRLEGYVRLLETRVDVQESIMQLYTAGREPATPSDASGAGQDAERVPVDEEDLRLKGLDSLLRSILYKQGEHNTDIRESTRGQKHLQWSIDNVIKRLNSIEETLRHMDRNVRTLVKGNEAG
jgi:hypothetical protein